MLIPCPELKWEKIRMKWTIRFTLCEAKYAVINEHVYRDKQTQRRSPSIFLSAYHMLCRSHSSALIQVAIPMIELHLYQSAPTASKWMHTYLITSTSPSPTLRLKRRLQDKAISNNKIFDFLLNKIKKTKIKWYWPVGCNWRRSPWSDKLFTTTTS